MIRLIIFDLDGTLVNSIFDLANAVNSALNDMGFPVHEVKEFYQFVGNGTIMLAKRALPEGNRTDDEVNRLHTLFAKNYQECCLDKTRPYDSIVDTVNKLKEKHKFKLAVASNKTDIFAKHIVDSLFGKDTFDAVVGKNDDTPAKPDPTMIFDVMERFGIDKSEVIFVGDSNVDVATAHNAGIKCIGCEWGFRGRDELLKAGADYIIDTPQKIIDITRDL